MTSTVEKELQHFKDEAEFELQAFVNGCEALDKRLSTEQAPPSASTPHAELPYQQARLEKAEQALQAFQTQHSLLREPFAASTISTWSLVLILLVGESLLNTMMFAQANPNGILGGFFTAFIISFINVGIALFAGQTAYRYAFFYKRSFAAVMGMFGVGLHLLFIAFYALIVAHYRTAISTFAQHYQQMLDEAPKDIGFMAWDSFTHNIWGIGSFEGIILCFLTILVGLIATYKGIYLSEPYPGYQGIWKNFQDTRQAFLNALTIDQTTSKETTETDSDAQAVQHRKELIQLSSALTELFIDANRFYDGLPRESRTDALKRTMEKIDALDDRFLQEKTRLRQLTVQPYFQAQEQA